MFIAVGRTGGVKTKKLLNGKKGREKIYDVFELETINDFIKNNLYVFEEDSENPLYLVSFDMKRLEKNGKYPTKEYSKIAFQMKLNLCCKVDNSTYLCPRDTTSIPLNYTDYVTLYLVKPHDEKTRKFVSEKFSETINEVEDMVMKQKTKGRGKTKLVNMVSTINSSEGSMKNISKYVDNEKIEELKNYVSLSLSKMKKANA